MNLDIFEKIKELLQRNIFLENSVKSKILNSNPEKWAVLYQKLLKIDTNQTTLFTKILIKNPNFFGELKNKNIHLELKKILDREEIEHLEEIALAEKELLAALF